MRIADELRIALTRAMEDAQKRKHEYLTLEHVLLALLHDPETSQVIKGCGGNLREIEQDLDLFLEKEVDRLPEQSEEDPQQTMAFTQVFQRAAAHVLNSGKAAPRRAREFPSLIRHGAAHHNGPEHVE